MVRNITSVSVVQERADRPRRSAGIEVQVARSAGEVKAGWELVYQSYHHKGLIDANSLGIHLVPQSVQESSALIVGRREGRIEATLSCYTDEGHGIPLDAVYGEEIDAMRQPGMRLMETGMFADRAEATGMKPNELFELMRFAFHYGHWAGCSHMLIGVHPHHEGFYRRLIGFEVAGSERCYGMVRDLPVVLLMLDLHAFARAARPPRGMKYFLDHPVPRGHYDARFRFHADTVHASLHDCVTSFVELKHGLEAAA